MLLVLHYQNKETLVYHVMMTLHKYGFGIVWECQGVGDVRAFLKEFKLRLIDNFMQDWHYKINSSDRFEPYNLFKTSLIQSNYLLELKHIGMRDILIKFRLGVTDLNCHRHHYGVRDDNVLKCPFCQQAETELHFLFVCPKYIDLREQYIPRKFYKFPCLFRLSVLLSNSNKRVTGNLACYIMKAMERRNAVKE